MSNVNSNPRRGKRNVNKIYILTAYCLVAISVLACCLMLLTYLGMNQTVPLSWVAYANAGMSITAAAITWYVAKALLKENKLLEYSLAEGTREFEEINHT